MRSVRSNVNNPNRVCDPVNNYGIDDVRVNNYQLHTSSEDEDELTQLKPNKQPQKRQQQHKNSKKTGVNKKSTNIGGAPESSGLGPDLNPHNFLLVGGQYEDAASPNGSENAYAEASLLPTSMSNHINRQDNRYDQGTCDTNLGHHGKHSIQNISGQKGCLCEKNVMKFVCNYTFDIDV